MSISVRAQILAKNPAKVVRSDTSGFLIAYEALDYQHLTSILQDLKAEVDRAHAQCVGRFLNERGVVA